MSGIAVLLGLLIVAYVGSMLVGGRTIRGFGLPSGAEYLVLGVVVGPNVLGLLPRSTVRSFEPIFVCAAAWLALIVGLGYFVVGHRRVKFGRALVGIVTAYQVQRAKVLGRSREPGALASGKHGSDVNRAALERTVPWE